MQLLRTSIRTSMHLRQQYTKPLANQIPYSAQRTMSEQSAISMEDVLNPKQMARFQELSNLNATPLYDMNNQRQSQISNSLLLRRALKFTPVLGYFAYFISSLPVNVYSLLGFYGSLVIGRMVADFVKEPEYVPLETLLISGDKTKFVFVPLYKIPPCENIRGLDDVDYGANQLFCSVVDAKDVEFRFGNPNEEHLLGEKGSNDNKLYAIANYPDGRFVFEIDIKNNEHQNSNEFLKSLVGKNKLPAYDIEEYFRAQREDIIREIRNAKTMLEDKSQS